MSKEILRLIEDMAKTDGLSHQKPFEIRSYGKAELAMLYFPDTKTKKGALNNLNYWIAYNGELRERLRALGMPPRAHRFTAREVALIVEYLCEP